MPRTSSTPERRREVLQRPPPAVAEADEVEAVGPDALADHRADHRVEPGTVAATGQHTNSHGSTVATFLGTRNRPRKAEAEVGGTGRGYVTSRMQFACPNSLGLRQLHVSSSRHSPSTLKRYSWTPGSSGTVAFHVPSLFFLRAIGCCSHPVKSPTRSTFPGARREVGESFLLF